VPIGGCWLHKDYHKIYNKSKEVSMITSKKNFLPGHLLRAEIIKLNQQIDIFGRGYKESSTKLYGLQEYKFSLVIENCKKDYYFTEKLIDCFVTGTIPIYWGCPSIGKFFDSDGILTFDTIDEFIEILQNLDGVYEKKLKSIKKNFNLSKKYLVADDLLYKKIYKKIF